MKKVTITDAILAIEALGEIEGELNPLSRYKIARVKKVLLDAIETARPFATGDEKKDQWLSKAETPPFEPLVLKELLMGPQKIEPRKFLSLKRVCS